MRLRIAAHRGGTDRYPELTIAAARHSLQRGADVVELDIRFTKDRVPVISHDDDALALFGHPAKISELTAEQFVSLRYLRDRSYRPHTLEEVLASGIAPILFHIKEGGEPLARILAMIRARRCERGVIMGVSSLQDVRSVKAFSPAIEVLAFMPAKSATDHYIDSEAEIIRLWEDWVDAETVRRIRDAGKQVWVMAGSPAKGTVGHTAPANIAAWKRMGVSGVLVDLVEPTIALR